MTPHDSIDIRYNSGFEVFPGTGTVEDPYVIEGYNIITTDDNGIYITDTTKYFIIRNCYVDAENNGIYIDDVADGTATVINNTCSNNTGYGILLGSSGSSTVTNNTCSNNNDKGIYFYYSDNSTISNNTCNNNNYYGIYLYYSDFCNITCNLLQENEEYGIWIYSSSDNNLIHHNNLVDNYLEGTSQACDDCTTNFWYDSVTQKGNYWSDWSGTGSYSILGSANSVDLYPLDEPVVSTATEHTSTEHTTTEHTTVESTTDENQLSFTFTLLMLVAPLILTRIISKKTKKK